MSFRLVHEGWGTELESALCVDRSELRIVCPFIKTGALKRLLDLRPEHIHVITRYNLDGFAMGISDIAVLRTLLERGASVRGIKHLHAKLYVFGKSVAIITSANLTDAGLDSNHEFGIVTEDRVAINRCLDYFDALWSQGGRDLQPKDIDDWTTELTDHLASGARPRGPRALPDYGADAGLIEQPRIAALPLFTEARQAFVKFHGTSENRAPLSGTTLGELEGVGCHWALAYPAGKRPRIVRDGDLMFIASLTEAPPDIRVFGRAIAMRHEEGRDDATPVDIARLE